MCRNVSVCNDIILDNEDKRSSNSLKRKKFLAEENDPFNAAPKRRSARVRNVGL